MDDDRWKQLYQGVFNRAASTYGQIGPGYFAHFGRRLVEFARIPTGARVIDVACGRGAVLFPAVQAAGPAGEVIGVDYAVEMVAETSREIKERGLAQARVVQMDAEHLRFEDERFDVVMCGFAIFFFPHLDQALSEMRRVLAPGGCLAVSTWGKNWDKRWDWVDKLFEAYLPPEPKKETESPPDLDFGSPEGVSAILAGGSLGSVRVETDAVEFLYRSEEEWWLDTWSHGGRRPLEEIGRKMGVEGLECFKGEAFQHLQATKTLNGFPERREVVLAAGYKI